MVCGCDSLNFHGFDIYSVNICLAVIVVNHFTIKFAVNVLTSVRDKNNFGSQWIPRWIGICKYIIGDLSGNMFVYIVNINIAGTTYMSHKSNFIPLGAPGSGKNTIHFHFNFLAFSCFYINNMEHVSFTCFSSDDDLFTIRRP